MAFSEAGFVVGIGSLRQIHVLAAVAVLHFFHGGARLLVACFGRGDLFWAITDVQFIQLMLGVLLLRQRHLPGRFGGIALLLGDEVFQGQRFITIEIRMRADLLGFGSIKVRLRCVDVLLAIAVFALLVFGESGSGRRARFRNFLGAITARSLFGAGFRLLE